MRGKPHVAASLRCGPTLISLCASICYEILLRRQGGSEFPDVGKPLGHSAINAPRIQTVQARLPVSMHSRVTQWNVQKGFLQGGSEKPTLLCYRNADPRRRSTFGVRLASFDLGTGLRTLGPLIICFALESPAAMENSPPSYRTYTPCYSDSTCSVYSDD